MFRRRICRVVVGLTIVASNFPITAKAQKSNLTLVQVAREDSPSILQIDYWGPDGQAPQLFNVDGTGFFVGRDGYFVTAAHVLDRYKPNSGQLGATIHQKDKSGSGFWFNVIEKDTTHDLALCKLIAFNVMKEPEKPVGSRSPGSYSPVTSLRISSAPSKAGELIAVVGFPLGSFASPLIQMGNIAATDAMLSWIPQFPAGRSELLVLSVSANHGNSGGPVISLETGELIGMIIQYVPAPITFAGENGAPAILQTPSGQAIPQQSGLMVAIPAHWISELLQRHGVSNMPITFKEHMVIGVKQK